MQGEPACRWLAERAAGRVRGRRSIPARATGRTHGGVRLLRIAARFATAALASFLLLAPPVLAATPPAHRAPLLPRPAAVLPVGHRGVTGASDVARPASTATARSRILSRLFALLRSAIGIPYLWGGISRLGFDCSGLVQWAFAHVGIVLPRTTWGQYQAGTPVAAPRPGDLVFFTTYAPGPSHVGVYVGNHQFVQAGDSGVHVSSLDAAYWFARYIGARSVLPRS